MSALRRRVLFSVWCPPCSTSTLTLNRGSTSTRWTRPLKPSLPSTRRYKPSCASRHPVKHLSYLCLSVVLSVSAWECVISAAAGGGLTALTWQYYRGRHHNAGKSENLEPSYVTGSYRVVQSVRQCTHQSSVIFCHDGPISVALFVMLRTLYESPPGIKTCTLWMDYCLKISCCSRSSCMILYIMNTK